MDWAARNGHLDMVKWFHVNRSEGCTIHAMNDAARNGHLDMVKWLHANRSEGCTISAMDDAAENGHCKTFKFSLLDQFLRVLKGKKLIITCILSRLRMVVSL